MKPTRRGFLAFLGFGAGAAALPKAAEALAKEPECSCPVEEYGETDTFLGGTSLAVHLSTECLVHSHMVADGSGCGVYECDFEKCKNKRTTGLVASKERHGPRAKQIVAAYRSRDADGRFIVKQRRRRA